MNGVLEKTYSGCGSAIDDISAEPEGLAKHTQPTATLYVLYKSCCIRLFTQFQYAKKGCHRVAKRVQLVARKNFAMCFIEIVRLFL